MRAALVILLVLPAAPAVAQDLGVKAPGQREPVAIVGATIHVVSGRSIENGTVIFAGARIASVGGETTPLPAGARVIDGKGLQVYPGLVAAYTQLGLTEIGAVRATRDMDEVGAVTPEVRAAVAVNPDSTLLPVARSNGVLTAGVFPRGGAIPGRASVIRLDGWTWEDMAIADDAGLVVEWPSLRPVRAWWMEKSAEEQTEEARRNLELLEKTFARARAYHRARAEGVGLAFDLRLEAMRPVFGGAGSAPAKPVFFLANGYDQIVTAVRFAERHALSAVIVGGRDAPLCAPLLREHGVGVVVDGTFAMPRRSDSPYDEAYALPARLEEAGLAWCLASGQGAANERNLPYAAAMAVAHGLPEEAALRAMTLSAAEMLGLGAELGSLEEGKRATLYVTDGSPLLMTTRIRHAFIDGREVDLGNKQTALDAKYREKYRQLGH